MQPLAREWWRTHWAEISVVAGAALSLVCAAADARWQPVCRAISHLLVGGDLP